MQDEKRDDQRSLIKYARPVIVSTMGKRGKEKGEGKDIATTEIEDILNSILPPREYTKDKQQLHIESVSSTAATETDVIMLYNELNKRLADRKARETGICAIREELYAQCFDELIRQITIGCTHRGLLLVRIRDEMRMTIQAYQNLYESALSYGMRKALQGEHKQAEYNAKIQELTTDTTSLEKDVKNLEENIKKIVKDDEEDQIRFEKDMEDEVSKFKMKIKNVREMLEAKLSGRREEEEEKRKKKEAKEKGKAAKQGGGTAAK